MSFLRGSANYVWCTTSVLGKGATGAVFQGVNKHNGETVAVKTFNQLSHMRPLEVQMREFEVLQKVKHENIVKLLAIEEEQEGRGKVIVMELCTGGSLFNLLDDPENNFGLDEDEWLLVLSHLSAGMNHLRDNNLVHRDLKPGNIMKFIRDDGTIVYKLTDFGAARELQDDQQFVSLYGTEEYLHPDMYERAVLRKPVGKTFGATVDLWSIGVTLYHVATGNLPFRPFGGRRNKETMFHITTKKASGVISGVQTSENGPIQWNRELPASCLLSAGIRKHVTPLLASLLEANPQRMWSFENFFAEVTRVLSKKKVHVFYVNRLVELRVHLDKMERLENFQLLLTEQTDVDPAHQILVFQGRLLSHHVDGSTPGTSFPDTSLDDPIFLFSKENNNVALGIEKEVPTFPALPNLVSVENDATLAKSACAVGYAYKRKIECYSRCFEAIAKSVTSLVEVVDAKLDQLVDVSYKCKSLTKMTDRSLGIFSSSHNSQVQLIELLSSKSSDASIDEWKKRVDEIMHDDVSRFGAYQRKLDELAPAILHLNRRYVADHNLIREWRDLTRGVVSIAPASVRARTYVAKLKESWQHLLRDRASRTLTYNDEQFHILEKIKMQETMRVLADLLQQECLPVIGQMTEHLADWYKMSQTTYLQSDILYKDITHYEEEIETFSVAVQSSHEKYRMLLDQMMTSLREAKQEELVQQQQQQQQQGVQNGMTGEASSTRRQVYRALRTFLASQDDLWGIINENNRLIEHFGQLAVVSTSASRPSSLDNSSQLLLELDGALNKLDAA